MCTLTFPSKTGTIKRFNMHECMTEPGKLSLKEKKKRRREQYESFLKNGPSKKEKEDVSKGMKLMKMLFQ